jgi:hypothetical protein
MAGVDDQASAIGDQQRRGVIAGDEMRAEANRDEVYRLAPAPEVTLFITRP